MKNLLYILLLFPVLAFSQTQEQNYVKTMTYHTAHSSEAASDATKARTNVTYYDGLGRPIQQIAVKASGEEKNIITHIEYDQYGRQIKQYLPYASVNSGLDYEGDALLNTQTFYNTPKYENTLNPYSEIFFEASPLGRTHKQAAPGAAWEGTVDTDNNVDNDDDHTVKFKYALNKASEVRRFSVTFEEDNSIENTEKTTLQYNGYYYANELYKTITKDENWIPTDGNNKTTEEFKDKLGRIILKRTYNKDLPHDTYYIYDRYSNLTYVIPPLASDKIIEYTVNQAPLQNNYSWTKMAQVDMQLAEDYERYLLDYDNEDILNLDLIDQYGGQGGFSLIPQEDGTLTMNINIATTQAMPYRIGAIVDLTGIGAFKDTELGRISGTGYEYIFTITNNTIEAQGYGNVPSLNTSFNSAQKLDYYKNYPWTAFCKADPAVAQKYEQDIAGLDNSAILTTYTANDYGAMGGLSVAIDENDTVTLSINLSSTTPLELSQGNVISLPLLRGIPDADFGTITGTGYSYNISIRNNDIYLNGTGQVNTLNFYGSMNLTLTTTFHQEVVDGLCYIYHYDSRNRVVEKHIPDADWTYIVYDKLDRPVMTQDENQRLKEEWTVTKYDILGRPVYTGIYHKPGTTRKSSQNGMNTVNTETELYETLTAPVGTEDVMFDYTQGVQPNPLRNILTINYYDDYNFDLEGITVPTTAEIPQISTVTKGLPTGSKIRVMEDNQYSGSNGTISWITSVITYDEKGRQLWSHTKNPYLQTDDITRNYLDFTGQVTRTESTHSRAGLPDLEIYNTFQYDKMGRLLKHRQSQTPQTGWNIGLYTHVLTENHYDELGQLTQKGVGGKDGIYADQRLQTIDYTYNVRGWLTKINNPDVTLTDDLFAFKINYNNKEETAAVGLYNGNISETYWRSRTDNLRKGYFYQYDALNRIELARYRSGLPTPPLREQAVDYTTQNIKYDKNGNIKELKRQGLISATLPAVYGIIDNLTYAYLPNSNQLKYVYDSADTTLGFTETNGGSNQDYDYDDNGNMTQDLNKGIGDVLANRIQYNHLNLPTKIIFSGNQNGAISYIYDATGAKLRKITDDNGNVTTTDYANGFVYENGTLQFFSNPEGYAIPKIENNEYNPDEFKYIYQYKDHLGNVRLSYSDANNNGVINDAGHYLVDDGFESQSGWSGLTSYPSGFRYEGSNSGRIDNQTAGEISAYMDNWVDIDITEPTEYTFSAWVYSNGPQSELFLYMQDEQQQGTENYSTFSQIQENTVDSWVYVSKTVTVQPNIKKLKIRLDNNGNSSTSGYTVWFDNVTLKTGNGGSSEIIAEDNYYAFGMKHDVLGSVVNGGNHLAQKYKYNGKELQDELNLNLYDYGARNYDPALGRWFNVDALADHSEQIDKSPYAYAWNNPVYYTDPDGNCPFCIVFVVAAFVLAPEPAMAPTLNQRINIEGYQRAKEIQNTFLAAGVAGAGTTSIANLGTEVALDASGIPNPKDIADLYKYKGLNNADDLIGVASKESDDLLQGGSRISNDKLLAPPNKKGSAPIGDDGHPIELHHRDQTPEGPIDEMTRTDHRGGDNYAKNHPNTGSSKSLIDRKAFAKQRREHWKKEWESGRFDNITKPQDTFSKIGVKDK